MKALGAAGLAPVVGSLASVASVSGQANALGLMTASSYLNSGLPASGTALGLINQAAQAIFYRKQRDMEAKRQQRIGGMDHDIWSLASLPLPTKLRMQRQRDDEQRGILAKLGKAAGFDMSWAE